MENENICSSANKRKKHVTDVTVEAESTLVVPYVMIPMKLGEQNIEVKASVFESGLQDGVVKVLRVVVSCLETHCRGGENTSTLLLFC